MSKRTIRDYISQAFLARDKATVDQVIKDAEKELVVDPDDHDEPDGDEKDTHVHLHLTKNGDTTTGDIAIDSRFKSVEDSIKALDTKMSKFMDTVMSKDGDLPPWLKKDGDKDPDDKTNDAGELGGEEGAMTAQALSSVEPDLMEADPALNTGPSKMGDAAYIAAVRKGIQKVVKDTRARAEMLVPGMKFATFDAAPRQETAKLLCDMRRDALKKASTSDAGKRLLGSAYTADAISGLDCGAVRLLFKSTTDRARDDNNGQGRNFQSVTIDMRGYRDQAARQLKSINERNKAFWDKQAPSPGGRPN
jgi:hypothetical protein